MQVAFCDIGPPAGRHSSTFRISSKTRKSTNQDVSTVEKKGRHPGRGAAPPTRKPASKAPASIACADSGSCRARSRTAAPETRAALPEAAETETAAGCTIERTRDYDRRGPRRRVVDARGRNRRSLRLRSKSYEPRTEIARNGTGSLEVLPGESAGKISQATNRNRNA